LKAFDKAVLPFYSDFRLNLALMINYLVKTEIKER
jgi:hypothetical protein